MISKVNFQITPIDLDRKKSIMGSVVQTSEKTVSVGDRVIVSGPLASKVFQKARYIPGYINAEVLLARDKRSSFWKVQSIVEIESIFEETFVDKLLALRARYVTITQQEIKAQNLEMIEFHFELFSESQCEAIQGLQSKRKRLLESRRKAFNSIIRMYISNEVTRGLIKFLNLKVTNTSRETLDLLYEAQERYVRISDEELSQIEIIVANKRSFTRNLSKAITQVQPHCINLLKDKLARFNSAVEIYLEPNSTLAAIKSTIENSDVLNPKPKNEPLKLIGVQDVPNFE